MTDSTLEKARARPGKDESYASSTIDNFSKGIESLARDKAPGSVNSPYQVVKFAEESSLLEHLYKFLLQCREKRAVPQDMRDTKIIITYKNKGERIEIITYRGLSLLGIVGNSFTCLLHNILQVLQRHNAFLEPPDPSSTESLPDSSCRRNSANTDDPFTWHMSISPRSLTLSAEAGFLVPSKYMMPP